MNNRIAYDATADMTGLAVSAKLLTITRQCDLLVNDADMLATSFKHTHQLETIMDILRGMVDEMGEATQPNNTLGRLIDTRV